MEMFDQGKGRDIMMLKWGKASNVSSGHYTVIRLGNVGLMQIKVSSGHVTMFLLTTGERPVTRGAFRRGASHVMWSAPTNRAASADASSGGVG